MNPMTGRYDPDLELWVLPITTKAGDAVSINLGDRAMYDESVGQDVLMVLSPTLRMHPQTKTFTVSWYERHCGDCGSYDGGQELIYNRETGTVTYRSQGSTMGKSYDKTTLLASNINDDTIHHLIAHGGSYEDLGK